MMTDSVVSIPPYVFTVMTPSYNRAHTLGRVYASLQQQSYTNFEWVIVDDGSTDDTAQRVQQWQAEAPFPIIYHWQPNQHKKTAFNQGVRLARGELTVALDSDDTLLPDALAEMHAQWLAIPEAKRPEYLGIVGLCVDSGGGVVGDHFPQSPLDITSIDLHFRYVVRGEKFGCLRTDVLRQHPFPEETEGFVPESLVWRAISRAGYLTRFVNQAYRVYYHSDDSLSVQGKTSQQHALGLWMLAYDTVQFCLPWFWLQPKSFLLAAARYTRFKQHIQHSQGGIPSKYHLFGFKQRVLVACMWPLGKLLYWRDRLRATH